MALTLQSALAGGRYPNLPRVSGHVYPNLRVGGHGFPTLGGGGSGGDGGDGGDVGGRDSQELPMDLSRHRSPSPDVSITTGRNPLLDRAMGPPPGQPESPDDAAPHDLRLGRPSHSIIPFHKLRKHAQKGPRARLKRQRLEEAVSLLREREAADERRASEEEPAGAGEETASRTEDSDQPAPAQTPLPPPPQLMQQMLMLQQNDSVSYPSLLYLQYCAMMQSLQLQQALRRQQTTKLPPPPPPLPTCPAPATVIRRPDSASSTSSPAGTPPNTPSTPGTPGTPEEPPQRRRAPRTLTGKHVRQGQGASPETLRTLRRVILEKARLRELGLLPPPKPKPKGRRKK